MLGGDPEVSAMLVGRVDAPVSLPPPTPQKPASLPDIVVILLDAARADHFGAYGYPRVTTPHIDRLAAESLVFENVFATQPYTLASVPTMITGLRFVDHGVLRHEHVLRDDAVTLYEYLGTLGYRTVCMSTNPNNSKAKGTAQGCDEFEELWVGASRAEWLNPFRVSDRAIERLERGFDGQPVAMFLHYVPPHEPYRPTRRYDLFGDPAYDGDCDGELGTMQAIERGELQPGPADLAEVVSLYDGNLRKADQAVERLLRTLRNRERWDDTLVLVTSDHGEAFLEHGFMGHNTTIYDEMLHVPFILRLPRGHDAGEVDVKALASLEDLTPTLLGRVGLSPVPEVAGRDLFALDGRPGRPIVLRSAGDRPDYGLRSGRFKLIVGGRRGGDWRLYDLADDPAERRNRTLDDPATAACLVGLMEQRLEPAAGRLETEERAWSEEELEALRALGYVQ